MNFSGLAQGTYIYPLSHDHLPSSSQRAKAHQYALPAVSESSTHPLLAAPRYQYSSASLLDEDPSTSALGLPMPPTSLPRPAPDPTAAAKVHQFTNSPDESGQIAPPGMKPRVTATLWEDEGSLCFQVEAKGVCVARRVDNHMINGTKLLNVAGMTRGRRDGILKSEKVRQVVKIGPMHLKGVWIPFDRALEFANKEKITEALYPLFVHDIGALLYQTRTQTRSERHVAATFDAPTRTVPDTGMGRPNLDRASGSPTPPTRASSTMTSRVLPSLSSLHEATSSKSKPHTRTLLTKSVEAPTALSQSLPGSPASFKSCQENPLSAETSRYAAPRPLSSSKGDLDSRKLLTTSDVRLPGHSPDCVLAYPHSRWSCTIDEPKTFPRESCQGHDNAMLEPPPLPLQAPLSVCSDTASTWSCDRAQSTSTLTASPDTSEYSYDAPSTTNYSEDDAGSPDLLRHSARVEVLVDRLMRYFFQWLCPPAEATPTQVGDGNSTQAAGRSGEGKSSTTAGSQQSTTDSFSGSKRDRSAARRDRDGEGERGDDDRRKRPRRPVPVYEDASPLSPKKLACPYFKRKPRTYGHCRSCPGPGWDTVHRLKEHLYRRHMLPIYCKRCGNEFKSEPLLTSHQREVEMCSITDREPYEGLDERQKSVLKQRQKMSCAESEVDKWRKVYIILFPNDDESLMPSPFYNLDDRPEDRDMSPGAANFARYERFLRQELPSRVREHLYQELERELQPVEERVRSRLPTIVRLVQRALSQAFCSSSEARDVSTTSVPGRHMGVQVDDLERPTASVPMSNDSDTISPETDSNNFMIPGADDVAWRTALADDNLAELFSGFPEDMLSWGLDVPSLSELNAQTWPDSAYGSYIDGSNSGLGDSPADDFKR